MNAPTERCPVKVWDFTGWHESTCNRPVKRNGLCGIHARAQETRAENDRKNRERVERLNTIAAAARDRLAAHGVDYQPTFTAAEVADLLDEAAS